MSDQSNGHSSRQALCWACFIVLGFAILFIFLIWNSTHTAQNFDALTISITALEIFLIVTAFGGFWLLRGVVEKKAEETTKEYLESCIEEHMKNYMKENGAPIIRREVTEFLQKEDTKFIGSLISTIGEGNKDDE